MLFLFIKYTYRGVFTALLLNNKASVLIVGTKNPGAVLCQQPGSSHSYIPKDILRRGTTATTLKRHHLLNKAEDTIAQAVGTGAEECGLYVSSSLIPPILEEEQSYPKIIKLRS